MNDLNQSFFQIDYCANVICTVISESSVMSENVNFLWRLNKVNL